MYLRLAWSTDKASIQKLGQEGQIVENPQDAVKDPYILEFLQLQEHYRYQTVLPSKEELKKLLTQHLKK